MCMGSEGQCDRHCLVPIFTQAKMEILKGYAVIAVTVVEVGQNVQLCLVIDRIFIVCTF